MTGRGFGTYLKGPRIFDINTLHVGTLVLAYSARFNAENTIFITREFDQRVWGVFVAPDDWTNRQSHEFCIWDFELELRSIELWQAIPADKKHHFKELA
jgi:hypothetical protein